MELAPLESRLLPKFSSKWALPIALGTGLILSLLNLAALVRGEFLLTAIPFVLALLYLSLYRPLWVLGFMALALPWAVKVDFASYDLSLSVPSEPFAALLTLLLWAHLLAGGSALPNKAWRHPMTLVLIAQIAWLFIASLASSLPLVSIKFVIARIWFLTPFYFLAIALFQRKNGYLTFFGLYSISLVGVVIYSLVKHYNMGLTQMTAHHVSFPFYSDHTIYAAALAMLLPLTILFSLKPKTMGVSKTVGTLSSIVTLVLFLGILLSYTRAAWVGLAIASIAFIIIRLRIKRIVIFIASVFALVILAFNFSTIKMSLEENKQESTSDVEGHLQSITNISTDASNTERINRWQSAIRMFEERPLFGWGPGTYMFQYGAFQLSSEMTRISTRGGDLGNAHSEYLGPLAEAGWPGLLMVLLTFGVSIWIGVRLSYKSQDAKGRLLALALTCGLITYYVHGVLNNFLDIDKMAALVFASMAALVSLEISERRSKSTLEAQSVKSIE